MTCDLPCTVRENAAVEKKGAGGRSNTAATVVAGSSSQPNQFRTRMIPTAPQHFGGSFRIGGIFAWEWSFTDLGSRHHGKFR